MFPSVCLTGEVLSKQVIWMVGTVIWLRSIKLSCSKRKELGQSSQNGQGQIKRGAKGGSPKKFLDDSRVSVNDLVGRRETLEIFIQINCM
jgi:hypothetical protein